MFKFISIFFLILYANAFARCFDAGNKSFCELSYEFKSSETNFINTPEVSLIKKLKINDNLIIKDGHTFYKGISGINYIAKTSVPIPEVFFNETIQFIEIEWINKPTDFEIYFSTGNRGVYSALKFLYPSLMSLIFALILFVLKSEFKKDSQIFNLGIFTGIVMSFYLYFNSLNPYTYYIQYSDGLLKIHILLTSIVTTAIQGLTDKILKLFKRPWYWFIVLITLVMILITPGWYSNNNFQYVIWSLLPTFILSTLVSVISLYKIIKNPNYVKNKLLAPLVIVGVVSMILSVIDTTYAVSESFSDAPISGLSLLLYYFVMMLTYFLLNKQMEISSLMINKQVAIIAKQVAHDIKSPLTALKLVSLKLKGQLTSIDYTFLQRSISRITDIIYDLSLNKAHVDVNNKVQNVLLYPLIDSIISEKRLTLKNDFEININDLISDEMKSVFVEINPSDLKRSISNILNNSLEAFENDGEIDVFLEDEGCFVKIIIKDNGKGIPSEMLSKVVESDFTHGKKMGQGLGLSFAFDICKQYGGDLLIESIENEFTKVFISIPKATPPLWFCNEIQLNNIERIIIVDDDYNLHRIWEGRFKSALGEKCPEIKSYYNPDTILKNQHDLTTNSLILCDYEFIGSTINGLELLEKLQCPHCVLVTGRSEEESIQNKVIQHGFHLLPKELINSVSLVIKSHQYVLIDDDLLVRKTWEMQAKSKSIILYTFSDSESFLNNFHQNLDAYVYVDINLNGENGLDLAEKLFKIGYRHIFIASGEDELELPLFIKGRVLKEPPF